METISSITIKDVAKEASVSFATVSRVLNNPELVNKKTKEKILNVIDKLNYSPSYFAQGMRKKNTKTIGVIIPDFLNYWYSELVNHIEDEVRERGWLAIICSTKSNEAREQAYIKELIRRQIDGLIICLYRDIKEYKSYIKLLAKKIPIVLMDESSRCLPISSVRADSYNGIKNLVDYLIKKGHKKIAFIINFKDFPVLKERYNGYRDALKENNYKFDKNLIGICRNHSMEEAIEATKLILKNKPSVIIGASDILAIGALFFVTELGLKVPEDIAVAGYDNIRMSKLVTPKLTTVAEPIKVMAQNAVIMLLKKINNKKTKNEDILLKTKLIIRDSV